MSNSLLVVIVSCHLKPERVEEFREATRINAQASVDEAGIARFGVIAPPAAALGTSRTDF